MLIGRSEEGGQGGREGESGGRKKRRRRKRRRKSYLHKNFAGQMMRNVFWNIP